jgi:hypothetical protein
MTLHCLAASVLSPAKLKVHARLEQRRLLLLCTFRYIGLASQGLFQRVSRSTARSFMRPDSPSPTQQQFDWGCCCTHRVAPPSLPSRCSACAATCILQRMRRLLRSPNKDTGLHLCVSLLCYGPSQGSYLSTQLELYSMASIVLWVFASAAFVACHLRIL